MLAVWSTRVGITWVRVDYNWCWWNQGTGRQRISFVSPVAGADGVVVPDRALGIAAACSRTGISTFLLHASEVIWTLGVDETLWATANIRVTNVVWKTAAGASPVPR